MEITGEIREVFRALKKLTRKATPAQRKLLLRETASLRRELALTGSRSPSPKLRSKPATKASLKKSTSAPESPCASSPTPSSPSIPPKTPSALVIPPSKQLSNRSSQPPPRTLTSTSTPALQSRSPPQSSLSEPRSALATSTLDQSPTPTASRSAPPTVRNPILSSAPLPSHLPRSSLTPVQSSTPSSPHYSGSALAPASPHLEQLSRAVEVENASACDAETEPGLYHDSSGAFWSNTPAKGIASAQGLLQQHTARDGIRSLHETFQNCTDDVCGTRKSASEDCLPSATQLPSSPQPEQHIECLMEADTAANDALPCDLLPLRPASLILSLTECAASGPTPALQDTSANSNRPNNDKSTSSSGLLDIPGKCDAMEASCKRKSVSITTYEVSNKRARTQPDPEPTVEELPTLSELFKNLSLDSQQEQMLIAIESIEIRRPLVELLPVLAEVASARSLERLRDALNHQRQAQAHSNVNDLPAVCRNARYAAALSLRGRIIYRSYAVYFFDRICPLVERLSDLKSSRQELLHDMRRTRVRTDERKFQIQQIERQIREVAPRSPFDSKRRAKDIVLDEQARTNCESSSCPSLDFDAETKDTLALYNVGQRFSPLNRWLMPIITYLWPDDDKSEQKARLVSTRLEQDPAYIDVGTRILNALMPRMPSHLAGDIVSRIDHAFRFGDTPSLKLQTMTNDEIKHCSQDPNTFSSIFNETNSHPQLLLENPTSAGHPSTEVPAPYSVDETPLIRIAAQQAWEGSEIHTLRSPASQQLQPSGPGEYSSTFDFLCQQPCEGEAYHPRDSSSSQQLQPSGPGVYSSTFDFLCQQPCEGEAYHPRDPSSPHQLQPSAQREYLTSSFDFPHAQTMEDQIPNDSHLSEWQQQNCDSPHGQPQQPLLQSFQGVDSWQISDFREPQAGERQELSSSCFPTQQQDAQPRGSLQHHAVASPPLFGHSGSLFEGLPYDGDSSSSAFSAQTDPGFHGCHQQAMWASV